MVGVLIQRKMVGDLFFLHLKSEKSMDFEHKRGVPGKGKTENFGCFMAFSRSPNSPNGEFKTKKASRFDWRRFYSIIPLYTSGLRRLCVIFANSKCFIAEQSGAASSEKADL